MAFSAVEYSILQDLVTIGQGAGTGVALDKHVIRELPKVSENIDLLPCVIYTPHGPVQSDAMAFEGCSGRVYTEEVCLIDYRDGDAATDQQKTQTWHEQLLRAIEINNGQFRTTLPNTPTVWSVEIETAPNFDRSKLNENYAYLSVVVRLRSAE